MSAQASQGGFLILRALAGLPEGVLLWITVGLIARSRAPERGSGLFFSAQVAAQLALAAAFWLGVMPWGGAAAGLRLLGLVTLGGAAAALVIPSAYPPLAFGAEAGGPPLLGWAALLAAALYVTGNGAVSVYLQPLARAAGLSADLSRFALVANLAAQLLGGAAAVVFAGRLPYGRVLLLCAAAYLGVWAVYALRVPSGVFVGATLLSGVVTLLSSSFLTPMIIAADPTRRAALQLGGAQIAGAAGGPLLASLVVTDASVRPVLALAAGVLAAAVVVLLGVRRAGTR
jgi:hypothetical protein